MQQIKCRHIISGILFFLITFSNSDSDAKTLYSVQRITDGDTIKLTDGRRIRFTGINAPEVEHKDWKGKTISAEPFANQARSFTKNLLTRKKVFLEPDKQREDRYGRFLAYVFLPDGTFINKKLIQEGLAYCLPDRKNKRYEKLFLKAQQGAMRSCKGLWATLQKSSAKQVAGNAFSRRFHTLECPFGKKIAAKNRIVFTNQWDAFFEGFAPCKKCERP